MESKELVYLLDKQVPSFIQTLEADAEHFGFISPLYSKNELLDKPYPLYQDFGIYLLYLLNNETEDENNSIAIQECFDFIRYLMTSKEILSSPELFDVIYLGLFGSIAHKKEIIYLSKRYLNDEAAEAFERWMAKFIKFEPFI